MSLRIALLADGCSIHVVRWANALADAGHQVHVVSARHDPVEFATAVRCHRLPFAAPIGYFLNVGALRRTLATIGPDVLSTHFASGYGTLGRLSRFQPNVLSVWGSDVYEFPDRSKLHRKLLEANLRSASWICSTSHVMATRTRHFVESDLLSVVPFGIDTGDFAPGPLRSDNADFVVGTVKALYPKYGIDLLIRAFAEFRRHVDGTEPDFAARLRLEIVGSGPSEADLRALARDVGVADVTSFSGRVRHADVPERLRGMDVYVALSRSDSESFGVAILEASACGLPVVVAEAGGLPEVVRHEVTGLVVEREDASAAARALVRLTQDADLRRSLGAAGRRHVLDEYSWPSCVERFVEVLERVSDS